MNVTNSTIVAQGSSCSSTTISRTLFIEDFGTFSSISGRASSSSIINIPYDDAGEVQDGRYAIVADCNASGASWALSGSDHTSQTANYPSGTYGGMLFFNAGNTGGIVFFHREVEVCANTNLQFSAWHANVHPNSSRTKPDITFNIYGEDGVTLLGTASASPPTSTTGSLEWHLLSHNFNSGSNTRVILEITNNVSATSGNDIAIDDISFRACLPIVNLVSSGGTSSSIEVTTETSIEVEAQMDNTSFSTPTFLLQKSSNGIDWTTIGSPFNVNTVNVDVSAFPQGNTYLRIIVGADNVTVLNVASGNFNGCFTVSEIMTVIKICLPSDITVYAPKQTVFCGEPITLTAEKIAGTGTGEVTNWIWSYKTCEIGCENWLPIAESSNTLTVAPKEKIEYRVVGQTQPGCESEAKTIIIDVEMPTIQLSPTTGTTCASGETSVLLTAEKLTGYGNISEWSWSSKPFNGSNFTTLANTSATYTVSPNEKTVYQVIGLTSVNCVASAQTATIDVYPLVENTLVKDFNGKICGDGTTNITITATASGAESNSWEYRLSGGTWEPFTPNNTSLSTIVSPLQTTEYKFISTGQPGCNGTEKTVTIEVNSPFSATLSAYPTTVRLDELVEFTATPLGEYNYAWSNNLPQLNQPNNSYKPSITGNDILYSVTIKDSDNLCSATANITISVINLPTAITPHNNDGKNDTFANGYDIIVFNRIGQAVYDSYGAKIGWNGKINGKLADPGVYYYIIRLTNANVKGTIEVVKKN